MYKLKEEKQNKSQTTLPVWISLEDQKDQLDNVSVKSKPEHRPQ